MNSRFYPTYTRNLVSRCSGAIVQSGNTWAASGSIHDRGAVSGVSP